LKDSTNVSIFEQSPDAPLPAEATFEPGFDYTRALTQNTSDPQWCEGLVRYLDRLIRRSPNDLIRIYSASMRFLPQESRAIGSSRQPSICIPLWAAKGWLCSGAYMTRFFLFWMISNDPILSRSDQVLHFLPETLKNIVPCREATMKACSLSRKAERTCEDFRPGRF